MIFNDMGHPPLWLRHFMPWRLLKWIDDRFETCWAGMVMWKYGHPWSWFPTCSCFEAKPNRYDWCGKYDLPNKWSQ